MANQQGQQQQPKYSMTMKKSGLSPEKTCDLITSKANNLLVHEAAKAAEAAGAAGNADKIKRRIKSRTENVIQKISFSVNKDGSMHKGRISTKLLQKLCVIPAPTTDAQKLPSPKKTNEEKFDQGLTSARDDLQTYKDYIGKTKAEKQQDLWEKLQKYGKLPNLVSDDHGYLKKKRTGQKLSAVELCDVLDEATKSFVEEFVESKNVQAQNQEHVERRNKLKAIIDSCIRVMVFRVASMTLFDDDILTSVGYEKWRKHLWLVASFATLTIALDLYDHDKSLFSTLYDV